MQYEHAGQRSNLGEGFANEVMHATSNSINGTATIRKKIQPLVGGLMDPIEEDVVDAQDEYEASKQRTLKN